MMYRLGWGMGWMAAAALAVGACSAGKTDTNDDDDGATGSNSTSSAGGMSGSGGTSSAGGMTGTGGAGATGGTGGAGASGGAGGMGAAGGAGGMGMGGAGGMGPVIAPECMTALPLSLGMPASGVINPAGDKDHYVFNATAGQWLALATGANPNDDPNLVDTVITLYDGAGTQQLAESDDAVPRVSTDSELFYRVPATGSYCVRVQEYGEWSGGTPMGSPAFTYNLFAGELDFMPPSLYNLDSDPTPNNDTQATAQALVAQEQPQGVLAAQLAGLLDPAADVDVYSFVSPSTALTTMIDLMPSGPSGHGSTQGPGLIRLRDNNGAIIAELDYQLGADRITAPLTGLSFYTIEVNRPNAIVGTNDFYFHKLATSSVQNQQETEVNNTSAQSDVATPQSNGAFTSHFIGGTIPSADVDYWSFNATLGQTLTLACSASRAGSGLLGFTAELRDLSDSVSMQSETELDTADMLWSSNGSMAPVVIPQSGTYFLRFTAIGQKTGVSGNYYICGVHLQ